ncbi:MAG: 6-phosphogluconolactonase [Pseudomonadota bacterium]
MAVLEREYASAAAAARALADAVAADLDTALGERPRASLVVSGGRSPIAFFECLRSAALDWSRVVITLADERWVPPEHADSNARLVTEHLLQGAAAAARFVPLWNGAPTPADAIAERSAALAALPRPVDALVLGMGEDGHTASLFPGAAGLAAAIDRQAAALLVAIDPPAAPHPRLSLTLAALLDSRQIHLPVVGTVKQAIYRQALVGGDATRWPIAAVLNQQQVPVHVYLAA